MVRLILSLSLVATLLAGVVAPPGNTTTTPATMPCPPSYRCGDAVAVRYPFWIAAGDGDGTASSRCGYPGLGLECRGSGTLVLRLPSGEYGVTGIRYLAYDPADIMTLSVFDLAATSSGSCPAVAGRNLSLPAGSPPPLYLTKRDRNVTFLLNCSFTGLASDHGVGCLQHGQLRSYVFRDEASIPYHHARLCQQVVGMPVLNPAADDVVAALRTGFKLGWSAPAAGSECAACEQAGGLCGERREAAHGGWSFLCFSRSNATFASMPPSEGRRAMVAFSVMGFILVTVGIAICLMMCGFGGEGPGAHLD